MKHHEEALQAQCVQYFRLQFPKRIIFAIPNGGKRNLLEAVRLKRTGTLRGVSDIFIPEPCDAFNGLFIELKHGKGKLTKEQSSFLNSMLERGYQALMVNSFEEFQRCVKGYFAHDV